MRFLLLLPLLATAACAQGHLDACKYSAQARAAFGATLAATEILINDALAHNKPVPQAARDAHLAASLGLSALNLSCPVS